MPIQKDEMTDTAATLAEMWKECLDVTEVDETSDFLDQGGTSIAAVHLAASIQEHLAVAIDAIEIVEAPVFGQILALVRERRGQ